MFKYGLGFIVFDIEIPPLRYRDMFIDAILDMNRLLCSSADKIVKHYMPNNEYIFSIEGVKGNIYQVYELFSAPSCKNDKEDLIFRLCNYLGADDMLSQSFYMEKAKDEMLLEIDEHAFYGFSKNGEVLFLIDDDDSGSTKVSDSIRQIRSSFWDKEFYIFLIALHQRNSLLRFTDKMAEYDRKSRRNKISALRGSYIEFVTQGWFSQISNDEVATQIYKRWQYLFDNERLNKEISEQISTVDDYNQVIFSRTFEILSAIVFPVLTLSAIFGIGLFETSALFMDWDNTLVTVILFSLLGILITLKKK
ncbi:MAG: hypothetical protein ACOZCL_06760 [Bacillota bacterium]